MMTNHCYLSTCWVSTENTHSITIKLSEKIKVDQVVLQGSIATSFIIDGTTVRILQLKGITFAIRLGNYD